MKVEIYFAAGLDLAHLPTGTLRYKRNRHNSSSNLVGCQQLNVSPSDLCFPPFLSRSPPPWLATSPDVLAQNVLVCVWICSSETRSLRSIKSVDIFQVLLLRGKTSKHVVRYRCYCISSHFLVHFLSFLSWRDNHWF